MNVATTRNKVEQAFGENFDAVQAKLPGDGKVLKARKDAIGRFAAMGLPHRRIEDWKYTDLRNALKDVYRPADSRAKASLSVLKSALGPFGKLDAHRIVFVNGHHQPELDDLNSGAGFEVCPLGAGLASGDEGALKVLNGGAVTPSVSTVFDLNTAFLTDGALIEVRDGAQLPKPLLIVHVRAGDVPVCATTRHVIAIGRGAKADLVEVFVAADGATPEGQVNTASDVAVGDNARVTHVKCAVDHGRVTHLANWIIDLGKECDYRAFHLTGEVALSRSDARVKFNAPGSKLDFSGVFLGRDQQHIDTTLLIEHLIGHCQSRELFKGVLADTARGVFQGKVHVAPDAQKTDGKQMAQALMLSPNAEFDSKPELEIYADDVLCGHGSTAAEIDSDLLFYLRSRGIPLNEARTLLIQSFVGEAIDRVEHEGIRQALSGLARNWLRAL